VFKSKKVTAVSGTVEYMHSSCTFLEVLAELHRAQESAYNLRDVARQDFLARAKICSKLIKYPFVEDYTV
jgi:hypothetical protein